MWRLNPLLHRASALMALLLGRGALAEPIHVPGGAGRLDVSGYLDGLAVVEVDDGRRQRPEAVAEVRFDASPTHRLRGHLALRTAVGGPFEGAHAGPLSLVHAFQNHSPSAELNEAYAELRAERLDVRVGVQRIAWGKLDGIPPTDVINPHDFHDPFVRDFEETKIGIPAVHASYYLPDVPRLSLSNLRTTLIYLPIAAPSRLPLEKERWFPGSAAPPERVVFGKIRTEKLLERVLGTEVRLAHDLVIPLELATVNHRPPKQLEAGGLGVRVGGAWRDVDWDVYHYSGPETSPNADMRSKLFLQKFSVDPDGTLNVRLRARSLLVQAHDQIHMTGVDGATALGPATVRAEVAFFQDRPYLRIATDLASPEALARLPLEQITRQLLRRRRAAIPLGDLFVDLDSIEWGIGADSLVNGFVSLVQLNQIILLDPAPRLIISDPETRFSTLVRRNLLRDRLELEIRGAYSLARGGWLLFPRVSYLVRDDLRVRFGYLAIGGSRHSLLGQFGENDEAVFQVRYSF